MAILGEPVGSILDTPDEADDKDLLDGEIDKGDGEQDDAGEVDKAKPAGDEGAADKVKPAAAEGKGDESKGDAAKDPGEIPQGFVPHAALHQARLESKALRDQLTSVSGKLAIVDTLKAELDAYRKQGQSSDNKDPAPDKGEDPIAYLEWENRQMKRDLESLKGESRQQHQNQEENVKTQQKVNAFMNEVREQVLEFQTTAAPDYPDAFKHVMERRIADYQAMGITTEQEIREAFDREVMSVAATALNKGINPGQAMYTLAKNMGYTPVKKADDKGDGNDNKKPGGESLAEQLDRLEKGGKAGGMGAGGVATESGHLSLAEIDNMTDAEFDAYWNKNVGSNSIYQ